MTWSFRSGQTETELGPANKSVGPASLLDDRDERFVAAAAAGGAGTADDRQDRQFQWLVAAVGDGEADGTRVRVCGDERDVFDDALAIEGV
jgi:hypothetical protein